ncbi:MAG: M23 family metallopeptidase [Deltaproteobacteria bacterium]|jgi:murein DD-endopeptidase|nr:M23 family metallopeptidase [Deltaproteobacteria bacterium]MBW2534852.1 M23 family metallopeptidase [Deltaproteobacteria bacterium]
MSPDETRLSIPEIFGLTPTRKRLSETLFMLRGDPYTPASRFGLSSLRVLRPTLSLRCYLGVRRRDRRVPISCLFNHTPTPIEEGWSVRVTQVRDFRGGRATYDSHNGTDFAIPPGTTVVAAAPGVVLRVSSEFHRGGLKVFVDHGHGLATTYNHLGRSLVRPGQTVGRGEPIALSGSSGVDCVAAFPWATPHVHFNVWLDGRNVDPYAAGSEPSLWLSHNDPVPHPGPPETGSFQPTAWDRAAVAGAIEACRDPKLRDELAAETDPLRQAGDTLFALNYFPTRFEGSHPLYPEVHERRPLLDLPFSAADFVGTALPDR